MIEIIAQPAPPAEIAAKPEEVAALAELSAVLAHHLRNPLSSIKGAAQYLQHECAGPPQSEFLAIILDEVDGLAALTRELLEFAQPLYPEFSWASWNESMDRAISDVSATANAAGVDVVFAPEEVPCLLMDREHIRHAAANLLMNAVQATPRGGRVTASTRRTAEGVALVVHDNGCGVAPEQLGRIFVPFFTTKTEGTGLGLPMACKIAQAHGGTVSGQRNEGPGMTFTMTLPSPGERSVN